MTSVPRLAGKRPGRRWNGPAGAAPSSVSMAVLGVLLTVAATALLAAFPQGPATFMAVAVTGAAGLVTIGTLSALLTAAYVLPTLALGHWLARRTGHGELGGRRPWRWVVAGTTLGLLPTAVLPTLARPLIAGGPDSRQVIGEGLVFAAALWATSTPAALAAHTTLRREAAERPIRPVGAILLGGVLVLSVELTVLAATL
ncbi:hypothetical protein [Streptomyces luteolus]|uniref:Yip1 domain-containing protein n=1 Tax=Streptomyces luteolus TaxID=3043615 RepID=A0ABT6SRY0_9ACTN|nr:hypothetical protein [Streptomyces sp. B-S-A12]MDI3418364.1 hypothetical protein [Streptomyces sp. B-S-A12]